MKESHCSRFAAFKSHLKSLIVSLSITILICGCTTKSSDENASSRNSFGQRQVDQMLDDRPDMRSVLLNSDPVVRWVTEGFNGERLGQRVYWNANTPHSGRSAEHGMAYESYSAFIAISGGSETTPVDKWASVVYEMFNLENSAGFEEASKSAMKGKLDGDAYAERCVQLEFIALEKTRDFFRQNPLPKSKHGRDVWYNWVITDLPTFEEYKASFDVPGTTVANSNFKYFKEYYDTTLLPLVSRSRHDDYFGSVQAMMRNFWLPQTETTHE